MKRLIFVLLLIAFTTHNLKAQNYTVQNYTDENGLPQNSVKSIATDNAGFIWLATENGLVRYDGQRFVVFDKNKTNANSNRIVTLRRDENTNKLYGFTENKQLVELANGNVSPTPTNFNIIFKFENSTPDTYFFASGVPNGLERYISALPYIIQKKNGYVYKIFNGVVSLFHQTKLISSIKFDYKSQWRFFLLENELYYLDEELNLCRFNKEKRVSVELLNDVSKCVDKSQAKLYWNTNSGDVFLDIKNSLYSLTKVSNRDQVKTNKVLNDVNLSEIGFKSIYRNKVNGDVYVGTSAKGLFVYKKKQFNTLISEENYDNNAYYAQIPYGANSVLFTNGNLFSKQNNAKRLKIFDNYSFRATIAMDFDLNVWTAKDQGLYKFSPDLKSVIKSFKFPTPVVAIELDSQKNVYVGNTKSVYLLKNGEESFKKLIELKEIYGISYLKKSKEILWIGTARGLVYFDLVTREMFTVKELANKTIRSLYIKNNNTWITTYGDGIYLFSDKKLIRLPNDENNYLNTAHCILEDKNGFFWISTNKGLFKVLITDLLAYAAKKTTKVYYSYFNKDAGFNTNEFNGGCQPCGSILNDGDFTFPSLNGVVLFNPLNLLSVEPDKPIYIDKIELDGRELSIHKNELAITNDFNRLNVQISTPYFGNQENLTFEYKLANQDLWIQSRDQMISFSSLPPGENTLNIRKLNGFGVNNYEYKNISFIVPPHFYQTWWFIIVAVAVVSLCIYLYIKLRTQRVRRSNLNLEKRIDESTVELQAIIKAYEFSKNRLDHQSYFQTRLIGAITHDIKSPLKYLMMTGEALYKDKSKEIDKEGIKAIVDSSTQIYHFTDNLIQYAKGFTSKDLTAKQTFNFYDLVEEKINIFKPIAKTQNTSIKNEVGKEVLIKTNEHLLSVILHNLLDNAVKFTYAGKITISYVKTNGGYKIIIKDNGIGMDSYQVDWCNNKEDSLKQTTSLDNEPRSSGLGLIMVKELNKIIGGSLVVHAVKKEGTTFEITLTDD